jgi:hypothetical protein
MSRKGDPGSVSFFPMKSPTLPQVLMIILRVLCFWVVALQCRERIGACSWLGSLVAVRLPEAKIELCLGRVEVFQVSFELLAGIVAESCRGHYMGEGDGFPLVRVVVSLVCQSARGLS